MVVSRSKRCGLHLSVFISITGALWSYYCPHIGPFHKLWRERNRLSLLCEIWKCGGGGNGNWTMDVWF